MMFERLTLTIFWTAMLLCASLVIVGIWFEDLLPEAFFKAAGTLFVIGFACFLLWAPTLAYRFLRSLS